MPTRRHSLGLAACLVALAAVPLMPGLGQAAEVVQIKPRILIMFDTSGSMAWNVAGANTQGDGTNEAWLAGRTCCPGLGGSRLYLAKEAMKSMLDACGDIDFALAKFAQRYSTTQPAGTNPWASNQYTGNQVAGTWDILRYSGDNTLFNVQANWLSVPFKDDSASEIRSWMDHREYSATTLGTPATSIYAGPFNDYKEQELRADGGTPVGPAIDAARAYLAAVRAAETIADPLLAACRPYSVILLTDGEADNAPDARAAVQNLHSDGIDTWVIGLALASNNLDQLAADGGGHFDPVTGRAFFADSEDSLSSILYQIVAGSVRTEICNNLDDDCDGLTDEGVRNRCNTCGAEPAETCNGIDDDCDGQTDEGLTPPAAFCSHVVGDPTGTRGECEPGVYQCNGAAGWVCSGGIPPRTERCNALDDDCDGATDESVTYTGDTGQPNQCSPSPYAGIGSCNWGTYTCSSGSWLCGGYGEPTLEGTQCDGDDNDCDGEADEGVSQLCGGGTVNVPPSVCRQGIQYCDSLLSQPGDPIWTTCYGSIEARTETCNLLDDNCDGFVDNGLTTTTHPWLNQVCGGGTFNTTPATCRQGAWVCKAGQKTCCRNGVATCDAPIGPVSEGTICDDFDNDCDGEVDESIRKQCWVGELDVPPLPNHGDAGQCVLGWRVCNPIGTGWDVCIGAVGPTSESCDNVDNDCDGQTDEGLSNVGACGGAPSGDPSEGECQVGVLSCSTGTLSCAGDVGPILEACDGKDNDCDGDTDEGIYRNCWSGTPPSGGATGICHMGVQQCIGNDVWSACAGDVLPAEYELCNNVDDDCDGQIDEDPQGVVGLLCNECGDVWECRPGGELFCAEANSSAEVCDGLDNDCDGQTDEVTIPCGGCADPDPLVCPAGYEAGACQRGFQYCDSANATPGNPVWLADCIGQVGPRLELCDGVDNDCDGETDEGLSLVGQECSKGIGECDAATLQCVNVAGGTKTIACCASVDPVSGECVSPSGPTIEICDAKDNNCDSLTDENLFVPCGGCEGAGCTADPNEGQCQQGTSRCVNGVWGGCLGSVGPGAESCNLLDDDCDGLTDEGVVFVPATCAHSNTADPNEGICTPGTWQCVAGQESCVGGIKPQFEICSGLDEDCDGKQDWDTDEELEYVGEPCGSSSLGVCKKGKYACECDTDLQECELNCVGEVNSSTEECDCLDNDCDGLTDEDIPAGAVCDNNENGGATGACTAGVMRCLDCQWTCDAPANAEEACNNIDDDCDGQTDENLEVECPAGNLCVEGECAPPCAGQEASCPAGKTCEEATNPNTGEEMRVCVDDVCSPGTAGALPCADNPYFCTEEDARPPCRCDAIHKECLSPCEGKECAVGQVCVASVSGNKVTAQCVAAGPGCYGTGCDVGERCEDGVCADDTCAGQTCEGDTYCKGGECVAACVNQDCPVSCRDGECVDDPCAGKVCDVGLSCNKNTGQCERGDCWGQVCDYYQVCQDGQCVADPCWNVECPNGRRCVDGSCYDVGFEPQGNGGQDTDTTDTNTGGSSTDTSVDTSGEDTDTTRVPGVEDGELTKVLATGAGGCLCAATPGRSGSGWGALWLLALPLLLVVVRAGRRRALVSVWLTVAMAALLGLGCQVEPYEFGGLSGTDSTSTDGTSTGETDTTGTGGTAGTSTFPDDTASGTETCGTGADDDCDGVDDDCDGQTDEDANLASPAHCGSCDNVCAFEHAFAECDNGECKRGECATFWYDRDNNPQDCEFFCQPTVDPSDNLDLCDGVDLQDTDAPYVGLNNDCDTDGADEDVDFDTDPRNCGRCGLICRVSNAIALCQGGECRQGDCQADHYDFDSDTSNGCEYECELSNGGVEICDGKDNDCDNLTDENNADPGSVWGAQGGGACYEAADGGCDKNGENCHVPCAAGTWKCTPSGLRCDGGVVAAKTESCDNIDNDCDGATDEEEDIPLMGPEGSVCAVQVGVCPEGHLRCARTAPSEARQALCCADVDASGVCQGARDGIPSDEDTDHCDGIDNDCDGRIDESPDNPAVGMVGPACYFGQAAPADDPDPNLQGRCLSNPGAFRCYYGTWVCENAASPTSESCNNIDDNCNGQTDENLFQECHTGTYANGVGICRYGQKRCVSGTFDGSLCELEYPPAAERCDRLDNDCDGKTDEPATDTDGLGGMADDRVGKPCGFGVCQGVYICDGGIISCDGGTPAAFEDPCNFGPDGPDADSDPDPLDDDCDGAANERDVWTCGGCDKLGGINSTCTLGANEGRCQEGTLVCEGAASVCRGEIGPDTETCDGQDNDCDGLTDEAAGGGPIAGGSCGLCGDGTITCDGGAMVCKNATVPSADICDGQDNDCNALTPDGSAAAWYGQPCDGADADLCLEGSSQCGEITPGVWGQLCTDTSSDSVETCNGFDDDCDTLTDEGLTPPVGTCLAQCGGVKLEMCDSSVGWRCDYYCTDEGGTVECDASGNPVPEETLCDTLDNDCDGLTDESFDQQFNPQHCGGCNKNCSTVGTLWPQFGNVVPQHVGELGCQSGTCIILSCATGYVDDRNNGYTDCSYECTQSNGGAEICDSVDNDCDGATDENAFAEICDGVDNDCVSGVDNGVALPAGRCSTQGVCAGVAGVATCEGSSGWNCNYASLTGYQDTETWCDGLDNDCDGVTDEGATFANYGTSCSFGQGTCLRTGTYRCATNKTSTVCCAASSTTCAAGNVITAGSAPSTEICDGLDNDCDNVTDEGVGAGSTLEYVTLSYAGNNYDVFIYEASKPDADSYDTDPVAENDPGVVTTAACSADNKVPWTMVNYTEARAACQALNQPTANCTTSACWDLCPAGLWQRTCENASGGTFTYPYSNTYNATTCNGHDYSGSWDRVVGAGSANACIADWPADDIFDLSGNVEEWTLRSRVIGADTAYEIRGGSYNDLKGGMTCGFDFWAAQASFRMPNLGFRCCRKNWAAACTTAAAAVSWNFEGTSGSDWTRQGEWEIGAFNGGRVLATDLDNTYESSQNISATAPAKDILVCDGSSVSLRFRMAFQIESGSTSTLCEYDWGVLEVQKGSSWVAVATTPIYTDNISKRWCGSTGGSWPGSPTWVSYTANVSSYVSSAFRFRFRFVSDGADRFRGMYVDDIYLSTP